MSASRLSDFAIAEICTVTEFPYPTGVITATAVALAESGGYPEIVNVAGNHPPSRDRGLWQINSYYHPEVSDATAFDPELAAREVLRISAGGKDWSPWVTYTSGSYLKFVQRATIASKSAMPGAFVLHRYLRLTDPQMYGVDVAALQHKLRITSDGVFGPVTAAAVQSFQHQQGLTADGIVGPATCRALGWSFLRSV